MAGHDSILLKVVVTTRRGTSIRRQQLCPPSFANFVDTCKGWVSAAYFVIEYPDPDDQDDLVVVTSAEEWDLFVSEAARRNPQPARLYVREAAASVKQAVHARRMSRKKKTEATSEQNSEAHIEVPAQYEREPQLNDDTLFYHPCSYYELLDDQQPEVGDDQQPEVGDNQQPEVGDNQQPEVGDDQQPEVGDNQQQEVGDDQQPEEEDNQQPEGGFDSSQLPEETGQQGDERQPEDLTAEQNRMAEAEMEERPVFESVPRAQEPPQVLPHSPLSMEAVVNGTPIAPVVALPVANSAPSIPQLPIHSITTSPHRDAPTSDPLHQAALNSMEELYGEGINERIASGEVELASLRPDPSSFLTIVRTPQQTIEFDFNLHSLAAELNHQGMHAIMVGEHERARLFFSLSTHCMSRPESWYNLACAHALLGDRATALETLKVAVGKGFKNLSYMASDPDLESLHGQEFWELVTEPREELVGKLSEITRADWELCRDALKAYSNDLHRAADFLLAS